MPANVNSEDELVQKTFADYLRDRHGWRGVYVFDTETFGQTARWAAPANARWCSCVSSGQRWCA